MLENEILNRLSWAVNTSGGKFTVKAAGDTFDFDIKDPKELKMIGDAIKHTGVLNAPVVGGGTIMLPGLNISYVLKPKGKIDGKPAGTKPGNKKTSKADSKGNESRTSEGTGSDSPKE